MFTCATMRVVKLAFRNNKDLTKGYTMSGITAYDVANELLRLTDIDSGDVLTNLKIQKLVYYIQGFHLAIYDKPLFVDNFVAWAHGPVVAELYDKLKKFKATQVKIDNPLNGSITNQQRKLINEVNDVYGQFSAWKLRDMTHNESPWMTTESGDVISKDKIKKYFKTQLQN